MGGGGHRLLPRLTLVVVAAVMAQLQALPALLPLPLPGGVERDRIHPWFFTIPGAGAHIAQLTARGTKMTGWRNTRSIATAGLWQEGDIHIILIRSGNISISIVAAVLGTLLTARQAGVVITKMMRWTT
jgi:hypothetical protein